MGRGFQENFNYTLELWKKDLMGGDDFVSEELMNSYQKSMERVINDLIGEVRAVWK